MQRGRSPVSLQDLMEAGLIRAGQDLSFRKGPSTAVVTAEGTIRLGEREYTSPSTAARAAANGPSINGWLAWYVKEGTDWAPLAELRKRLPGAGAIADASEV